MSNYMKNLIYQHFSIIELLISMITNIRWQQRGPRICSSVNLIKKGPFISGGTFFLFLEIAISHLSDVPERRPWSR